MGRSAHLVCAYEGQRGLNLLAAYLAALAQMLQQLGDRRQSLQLEALLCQHVGAALLAVDHHENVLDHQTRIAEGIEYIHSKGAFKYPITNLMLLAEPKMPKSYYGIDPANDE